MHPIPAPALARRPNAPRQPASHAGSLRSLPSTPTMPDRRHAGRGETATPRNRHRRFDRAAAAHPGSPMGHQQTGSRPGRAWQPSGVASRLPLPNLPTRAPYEQGAHTISVNALLLDTSSAAAPSCRGTTLQHAAQGGAPAAHQRMNAAQRQHQTRASAGRRAPHHPCHQGNHQ